MSRALSDFVSSVLFVPAAAVSAAEQSQNPSVTSSAGLQQRLEDEVDRWVAHCFEAAEVSERPLPLDGDSGAASAAALTSALIRLMPCVASQDCSSAKSTNDASMGMDSVPDVSLWECIGLVCRWKHHQGLLQREQGGGGGGDPPRLPVPLQRLPFNIVRDLRTQPIAAPLVPDCALCPFFTWLGQCAAMSPALLLTEMGVDEEELRCWRSAVSQVGLMWAKKVWFARAPPASALGYVPRVPPKWAAIRHAWSSQIPSQAPQRQPQLTTSQPLASAEADAPRSSLPFSSHAAQATRRAPPPVLNAALLRLSGGDAAGLASTSVTLFHDALAATIKSAQTKCALPPSSSLRFAAQPLPRPPPQASRHASKGNRKTIGRQKSSAKKKPAPKKSRRCRSPASSSSDDPAQGSDASESEDDIIAALVQRHVQERRAAAAKGS